MVSSDALTGANRSGPASESSCSRTHRRAGGGFGLAAPPPEAGPGGVGRLLESESDACRQLGGSEFDSESR